MSWLIGKAEELLNAVDQGAADALQNEEDEHTNKSEWQTANVSTVKGSSHGFDTKSWLKQTSMPASKSVPNFGNSSNVTGHSRTESATVTSTKSQQHAVVTKITSAAVSKPKMDKDEELFKFLNSPDTVDGSKGKTSASPSSGRHSRHSSISSTKSSRSGLVMVAPPSSTGKPDSEGSDNSSRSPEPADENDSHPNETSSGYHSNYEDSQPHQASSLELENKLLRREVASLNEEMASIIQRAQHAQEEMRMTQEQMRHQSYSMSSSDQLVRELQSRESDLTEALAAKDSQLAVLRVRLDEADKELAGKKKLLGELESDRHRILKDHTDSSGIHNQALDSVKEKLYETELALRREQEAYKAMQQEGMNRQHKLESEQQILAESLTSTQRKLAEAKAHSHDLVSQLKSAKSNMESAKQDLTDYKDKAARILQSKDRLIATLKEGSVSVGGATDRAVSFEIEELKQERDLLKEELQRSRMAVENLRTEIQDLETQMQTDNDAAMEQARNLNEQMLEEKRKREDIEHEMERQKQELQYVHEESVKHKTTVQSKISDRENEIEKLRNQLTTKSLGTASQSELEGRLHALTENLIQKQTMLETLSTEKNSLGLQLERLERQYNDMQNATTRTQTTAIHIDDDEVRQRVPTFMRESPMDTGVTRKMKRAANTIDKFSIRLGVFLRRYPIARIFVIVYMMLLHLWTMAVLLTYQPEMHGSDYHPQAPGP